MSDRTDRLFAVYLMYSISHPVHVQPPTTTSTVYGFVRGPGFSNSACPGQVHCCARSFSQKVLVCPPGNSSTILVGFTIHGVDVVVDKKGCDLPLVNRVGTDYRILRPKYTPTTMTIKLRAAAATATQQLFIIVVVEDD